MSIDLTKVIGCKKQGDKIVGQCPACALGGNDIHSKNHLVIFPNGKFGCVIDKSSEHSKTIWKLVGAGNYNNDDISITEPTEPRLEIERIWPNEYLDRLVHDYSYWEKRGISQATIEPFRGGVALTAGQMTNRWVIPIFNANDQIIGFTGRALKEGMQPKWKHLSPVSKWIWGGLDEIEAEKEAILVESPGDLLMLREHGVNNVLCLFGVNMSQSILGYLIGANPDSIIISTNSDKLMNDQGKPHQVGQNAALRIKNTLDKFFNPEKITIKLPPVKDWGVATKEQIHESFNNGTSQAV